MKKLTALAATAISFVSATQALATDGCIALGTCSVPEISALDGAAALAVVSALVLLAWERRRRAA
ncbi:hypothetical protein [Rhodobacter sp. CZR27]|uniref:hypothetical protein n=1 Tax=Rhodobacter sp. CZR27 TaxID=2033869 RepID=UPI000BBE3E42|nr:hypothetical protein [Rhodobacter sp. CZR27]